jgi:DNA-binding HxlR family transcriptional regulator
MLALLWERKGERFVTLMRTLGASQKATRETLDVLLEVGLVMKNPGYGHPLRPEYILTEAGFPVGAACFELDLFAKELGSRKLFRSKWSLLVVSSLSQGPMRFSELLASLHPVTDRALIKCLKGLVESKVVERTIEASFPPSVRYSLDPVSQRLAPLVKRLLSLL